MELAVYADCRHMFVEREAFLDHHTATLDRVHEFDGRTMIASTRTTLGNGGPTLILIASDLAGFNARPLCSSQSHIASVHLSSTRSETSVNESLLFMDCTNAFRQRSGVMDAEIISDLFKWSDEECKQKWLK